ncbi:MAG TPA: YraN family protein [Thermosynechococcaceae cyanobacterium]
MPQKPKLQTSLKRHTSKAEALDIGTLGEALVAQWLCDRGWLLLQKRWHCRWGELDLVVGQPSAQLPTQPIALAFVEVKTRSQGNWDSDGALAITARKRSKLWKTAQLFLADHPDWAELPCQFDVALVCCRYKPQLTAQPTVLSDDVSQERRAIASYSLTLQDYIPAAFTLD